MPFSFTTWHPGVLLHGSATVAPVSAAEKSVHVAHFYPTASKVAWGRTPGQDEPGCGGGDGGYRRSPES